MMAIRDLGPRALNYEFKIIGPVPSSSFERDHRHSALKCGNLRRGHGPLDPFVSLQEEQASAGLLGISRSKSPAVS